MTQLFGWRSLIVLVALLGTIGLVLGIYMRGRSDERSANEAEKAVAVAEAIESDARADEKSAIQAVEDAEEVAELREELINEVQKAPESLPAPAAVALGCQRLLNAGHRPSDLPAVCRDASAGEARPLH